LTVDPILAQPQIDFLRRLRSSLDRLFDLGHLRSAFRCRPIQRRQHGLESGRAKLQRFPTLLYSVCVDHSLVSDHHNAGLLCLRANGGSWSPAARLMPLRICAIRSFAAYFDKAPFDALASMKALSISASVSRSCARYFPTLHAIENG